MANVQISAVLRLVLPRHCTVDSEGIGEGTVVRTDDNCIGVLRYVEGRVIVEWII